MKKEIKLYLKENGFTEKDMERFWNENIETNTLVRSLNNCGKHWYDLNLSCIKQLPTQKQKDLERLTQRKLEEEIELAKKEQEEKDRQYYIDNWETIIINKIDNKETLTEREISDLVSEYSIYRETGDDNRWTRDMFTVCQVNDRFFGISWRQGLTEYQENSFSEQPYEVYKHEYEKTITITEWLKK